MRLYRMVKCNIFEGAFAKEFMVLGWGMERGEIWGLRQDKGEGCRLFFKQIKIDQSLEKTGEFPMFEITSRCYLHKLNNIMMLF